MLLSMPLLECVPNFSEGSNQEVIKQIVFGARSSGADVIDVHSDPDHGRCVVTMIGEAGQLTGGVVSAAAEAMHEVDLTTHVGVHPRLGALDVVPFVPLGTSTMHDAVEAAVRTAMAISKQLEIPCFLYGAAIPGQRSLPQVRKAAFVTMMPDFGPARPHPTAGATMVGARPPLVAFNVNLESADIGAARRIATAIRERDGGLPHVRALGFLLASRGIAQVSTNLIAPETTTMADVFSAIRKQARKEGVKIGGCELVGVAPRAAFGGRKPSALGLASAKVLEDEVERVLGG